MPVAAPTGGLEVVPVSAPTPADEVSVSDYSEYLEESSSSLVERCWRNGFGIVETDDELFYFLLFLEECKNYY